MDAPMQGFLDYINRGGKNHPRAWHCSLAEILEYMAGEEELRGSTDSFAFWLLIMDAAASSFCCLDFPIMVNLSSNRQDKPFLP